MEKIWQINIEKNVRAAALAVGDRCGGSPLGGESTASRQGVQGLPQAWPTLAQHSALSIRGPTCFSQLPLWLDDQQAPRRVSARSRRGHDEVTARSHHGRIKVTSQPRQSRSHHCHFTPTTRRCQGHVKVVSMSHHGHIMVTTWANNITNGNTNHTD